MLSTWILFKLILGLWKEYDFILIYYIFRDTIEQGSKTYFAQTLSRSTFKCSALLLIWVALILSQIQQKPAFHLIGKNGTKIWQSPK